MAAFNEKVLEGAIPPPVARFIAAFVPSVVALEALLLLRARRGVEVSPVAVGQALYVDAAVAAGVLEALARHGLLRAADPVRAYAFAPATPELAAGVEELAEIYRTRLVPLHEYIHDRAQQTSAESFANAFRLRKD